MCIQGFKLNVEQEKRVFEAMGMGMKPVPRLSDSGPGAGGGASHYLLLVRVQYYLSSDVQCGIVPRLTAILHHETPTSFPGPYHPNTSVVWPPVCVKRSLVEQWSTNNF